MMIDDSLCLAKFAFPTDEPPRASVPRVSSCHKKEQTFSFQFENEDSIQPNDEIAPSVPFHAHRRVGDSLF